MSADITFTDRAAIVICDQDEGFEISLVGAGRTLPERHPWRS